MANLIQLVASGLALGTIYALIALGFVVIYRASQVFNFAQGELVTVGAFVMVALGGVLPWPLSGRSAPALHAQAQRLWELANMR